MRWPATRLIRVSDDLAREYWRRRREIARLHWDGAHHADIRDQCENLRRWVVESARVFHGSHTLAI